MNEVALDKTTLIHTQFIKIYTVYQDLFAVGALHSGKKT